MSTPKATQMKSGKWVVSQRKIRVLLPEKGMGDAEDQSQPYLCSPRHGCLCSHLIFLIWGVFILLWTLLFQVLLLARSLWLVRSFFQGFTLTPV